MGLKERQHIARIQKEEVPGYDQRLQERLGTSIHYDIEWTSFENDIQALYNLNGFLNNVTNGFEYVTRDEVGKETVAAQIERIVIKNVPEVSQRAITREDKTLHLHTSLGNNDDWSGRISDYDIQEWLENNL